MADELDFTQTAPAASDAPAAPPVAEAPAAGAPPDLEARVDALIAHESTGNPNAVGDAGLARGVGQMHPANRRAFGGQGRGAVTATLADSYKRRGNWDDAYSDYHLGQPNYNRDRHSPANLAYLDAVNSHLAGDGSDEAPDFSGGTSPTPV